MLTEVIVGGAGALWWSWSGRLASDQFPPSVTTRDLDNARERFETRYGRTGNRIDILSWLAEWYLTRNRLTAAVDCFSAIPTSHSTYGRMARYQQGRTLLSLHRAVEAEQQFRELISLEEERPQIEPQLLIDARQRLRHILEVELRFEERQQLLAGVVARGEADHFETVVFCFPSFLRWNGPESTEWLEQFYAADPLDPNLRVALGRYRTGQGKLDEARQILEGVVQERPDDLWAMAALLACLHEADDPDELARRINALPPQSQEDPWLLLIQRGLFAIQEGDYEQAIRAFEQLVKDDETSTQGWKGLQMASAAMKDEHRRKQVVQRVTGIGRIHNNLGLINRRPKDPETYLVVIQLCEEFEFHREGLLLAQFASRLAPDHPQLQALIQSFQARESTRVDQGSKE